MPKRKKSRRSAAVKAIRRAHRSEGKAIRRLGTIGATKRTLKNKLEKRLGEEMVKQFSTKLKRNKKKIGKRITKIKSEIRFLSK